MSSVWIVEMNWPNRNYTTLAVTRSAADDKVLKVARHQGKITNITKGKNRGTVTAGGETFTFTIKEDERGFGNPND